MNRRNGSTLPWGPLPALILLAAVLALYGPCLGGHFIHGWDDRWLVTENRTVHGFSVSHVRDAFDPTIDRAGMGYEYLPVRDLSYMLDFELWELNPIGYRVTSLLVHAASSFAAFLLLARLFPGPRLVPLAGALVFAVHPLAAEPAAWIAGRKDGLAVLFSLASAIALLSCADQDRDRGSQAGRYVVSLVLAALAMLSKSTAAGILAALPLLLLLERPGPRRLVLALPHLAVAILGSAVHFLVFRSGSVVEGAAPSGARVASLGSGILHAARTLLLPVGLSPHYRDPAPDPILTAAVALAGALALVLALCHLVRRCPRPLPSPAAALAFSFAWAAVALAPVLAPLPRRSAYLADRYVYPATLSLAVLVAALVAASARGSRTRLLAAALLLLPLAALARDRALLWRSEILLWRDAVEADPSAPVSRFNLASAYHRFGLLPEAESQYRACLELEPDHVKARQSLAVLLYVQGGEARRQEARALLRRAIEIDPRFIQARTALAGFLVQDGDLAPAEREIEAGLAIAPAYAPLWLELGNLRRIQGRPDEALAAYDRALELAPGLAEIERARESLLGESR